MTENWNQATLISKEHSSPRQFPDVIVVKRMNFNKLYKFRPQFMNSYWKIYRKLFRTVLKISENKNFKLKMTGSVCFQNSG